MSSDSVIPHWSDDVMPCLQVITPFPVGSVNPLPTKYAIMRHFKCARGRPKTHICVIETHLRAPEANTAWGRCKTVKELFRYRSWRVRGYRKLCYLGGAETQRETRMRTYRIIAKQLREQPLEVVVILSTQVAHLSVNNIPRVLLISVGGAGMARRQQVFTASQVGSLLDEDTEFVFSGSDDDFDVDLDEEFDPLESNHQSVI